MYELLDKVNFPKDIKGFSIDELRQLCAELRRYIVEVCADYPGHIASSLGAVELIVGIHYVFDTPDDKLVFDVGHQAYAHKILTGRKEAFRHLRASDGVSGFPRMVESEYDAFGVGHSSTSISAAVGFAEAARMKGDAHAAIALIGDGALTGGEAMEALNNAGDSPANLLVVLNDNNQSIDENLGGLHKHLLNITTSRYYNRFKAQVWNTMGESGLRRFIQRWIRSLKSWFVKKSGGDLFEALGLRYFGPIDGNDIEKVVATLQKLKGIKGPRIIHCMTVKGKGYPAAEADPSVWHAPGKFNPETGERIKTPHPDRFQDVFGEVLCQLADMDDRVVGVTPAMAQGCGMNLLAAHKPERFYDVGIEEQHSVTFSAGLAAAGMRPFCNIYSAFSQRAYDQIVHDVALQKLPVTLCFDRAGLVGEDGATHHGIFDLAAYRSIPNTIVSAPRNPLELKQLMYTALNTDHGPFIIRYPRGCGIEMDWRSPEFEVLPLGKAVELRKGSEVAIVGIGPAVEEALKVADIYPGKVGVYDFRFLKPFDTETMADIARIYNIGIVTVEDGCIAGGLFSAVSEWLAQEGSALKVHPVGVPDAFVEHGRQAAQRAECGLDAAGIESAVKILLQKV